MVFGIMGFMFGMSALSRINVLTDKVRVLEELVEKLSSQHQ